MARPDNIADIIIIGGGAAGCSVAMQLALRSLRVIVLERATLGSGSTSRAAGLGGQLRSNPAETKLLKEGLEVVRELERRLGKTLFVQTGSLHVASSPDRAREIRDFVAMGKSVGFDIDLISRERAAELLPCMKTEDLIEIAYCPTDGHFQPADLLAAFVQVAREAGAIFKTETPFETLILAGGRIAGVRAGGQEYFAPIVVNAAGPWSYLVGEKSSAPIAAATIGHFYLVTHPLENVPIGPADAAIRDRELRIYSRPEVGGLLVGTYETEPIEYKMEELPVAFDMSAMTVRRDSLNVALLVESASRRFSFINERTPMTVTHGIMTFTPDGHALCGAVPKIQGLYHCTAFCGRGVFQSAAVGLVMAELIADGKSQHDVAHLDADRFRDDGSLADRTAVRARCYQRYANHYQITEP